MVKYIHYIYLKERDTMSKPHQNKEFLQKAIQMGSTPKEIAKELHVSYKLVEMYLRMYEIKFVSQDTSAHS